MTTRHAAKGKLPFTPHHVFGVLLKKAGERLVLWAEDWSVEPAEEGSASDVSVQEAVRLSLDSHKNGIRRLTGLLPVLEAAGFTEVAARTWNFSSGILYQYARKLAGLVDAAESDRQGILARHHGRHPHDDDSDWLPWVDAVTSLNCFGIAARLIGVAAVEALVNEILAVNFPSDYERLEGRQPMEDCCRSAPAGFIARLYRLRDLAGLTLDKEWATAWTEENNIRIRLVHHRPKYEDDYRDLDSVDPPPEVTPEAIRRFVQLVESLFEQVFAGFSVRIPDTHGPGFV